VEWDDTGRGKNSGLVKGKDGQNIQFFQVQTPQSGSFLRFSALPPTTLSVISLLDAIQKRYQVDSDPKNSENFLISSQPTSQSDFSIEILAPTTPLSPVSQITTFDVSSSSITNIGDPSILAQTLSSATYIDLSDNLLSDWKEILPLLTALPSLQTLNLRRNRFNPLTANELISASSSSVSPTLHNLILNETNVDDELISVLTKSPLFSNLTDLHLAKNHLCTLHTLNGIPLTSSSLQNLHLIDLSINNISNWNDVFQFSPLPHLETLYLSQNALPDFTTIPPSTSLNQNSDQTNQPFFPSLKVLTLEKNCLTSLISIYFLSLLPNLMSFRLGTQDNYMTNPVGMVKFFQIFVLNF
jgi:hypothetical protein